MQYIMINRVNPCACLPVLSLTRTCDIISKPLIIDSPKCSLFRLKQLRPKLKLCWFAVYRPTRGFPCDPNIFLISKKIPNPLRLCLARFNRVRDPNQLTALNLSFQPMSVPLTMICVVKWLGRRKSPESKRLSACLSLSNEQRKSVQ